MNKLNLKIKFESVKTKLLSKVTNLNKKILILFFTVIFILIFSLIIIMRSMKYKPLDIPQTYVLEDMLIPPPEPMSVDSFELNRTTQKSWSLAESENLFTIPEGEVFQQIQLSNDQLIQDVLKDAP